jgi:diguanylate cyclase (GGDEF)-like protein/PAS domain S-box-containing protein
VSKRRDNEKTQQQLIKELTELRRRLAEREQVETGRKQAEGPLRESEEELEAIFDEERIAELEQAETRRAKGALRGTEEELTTILEEIGHGIILLDLTGKIITINKKITEISGYTKKDVVGKRLNRLKMFPPKDITTLLTTFAQVISGKTLPAFEVEAYAKTGEKRIVEIDGSLLRIGGKKERVIAFLIDSTARRQAEEALRESEEELEAIFNEVRDGIILLDLTGKIIKINKRITDVTGYTEKYIVGKRFDFFKNFPPSSIAKMAANFIKAAAGQRVTPFEVIGYTKTGEKRFGEVYGSLLKKKGKAVGVLVVMTDITERKEADEALQESEGRYRALVDNIDLGITLMDVYHNIIMVNAAQSAKFNKSSKEMIGKKCFREFEKRDTVCPHCPGVRTLATHKPAEAETEGVRDDGSRFQVRLKTFPILDQDGTAIGFIETAVDISKRKQAEDALRASEARYRTLVDNIDRGINLIDANHNIIFLNASQGEKFSKPVSEMIGKKCFREFEKRDTVCPHCPGEQTMATGLPAEIETEGVRDDGSRFQVRLQTFPVLGQDDKVTAFIEIAEDITERKQMEKTLRESEQKYRTILETMEEGYYEIDLAGNFTFFNEAECRIHGCSRDEMLGLNNKQYSSSETAKRIYTIFNKVYRTGIPAKIVDYGVTRKDGSVAMIETSASLLRNAEGDPIGFYGISRDRTEQKKAEEALRQSEQKYRTILEDIEEGYYEVDLAGNLTFFNDTMCRIHGYPRDEMMGMNNRQYMDKETAKRVYKIFNTVFRTGKGATINDWQIIRKDGRKLDVESSVSLMRDSGGNPTGFRGVIRDVTERKRAENALRESEEKYRSLVEFTDDSVYLVNRRKEYLFANETYLTHFGLSRDQVIGRPYGDFHSREDDEEFSEQIEKVLKTGRFVQYEHRSQTNGRYFLRTLSPVKKSEGSIETVTVIAKDITERKRAEAELVYMATHDALTGLPNRTLFNDRLALALAQADRNKKKLAVMLLDLDYFKDVNDTMGHSMGDRLLRVVGNRLRELLRGGDTVARVGGDEFLLLLSEIARIKDATTIAQKILRAFRKSFVFDDHKIMITTSIGVTIYPDDGNDASTLMKHADVAMYRAKDKGRDNFQRYTPRLDLHAIF